MTFHKNYLEKIARNINENALNHLLCLKNADVWPFKKSPKIQKFGPIRPHVKLLASRVEAKPLDRDRIHFPTREGMMIRMGETKPSFQQFFPIAFSHKCKNLDPGPWKVNTPQKAH